ncbi:hypothetical protein MUY14_43230 [Amycolatopsis sp. FBCC-B4732]|uniref:hypothetical protein n=1 Tax=Amycolatopsis sp. FBCC-B4732 TaxID=3079339 RepID=UPI001FF582E1|nr:hypothetical protein [Amycolatopsis sp. FBCC-B4732]UOX88425.1 hypothetical protein MUY14_43230 [Amycolatopsis sp. FBCC-B4732]
MSEQQDVISELGDAGVLGAVRWAYRSATARSLESYSESDGHDAAWLGNTRFTLFRNRLDRVFHCERYAISSGDGDADLDLLYAELSKTDIQTMPKLEPGLVVRSNLNGSPGWALGERRLLLAACAFGKLDKLPWPQRSPTKQRVAQQRNPEPPQPSLFEIFADDEVGGLEEALAADRALDMTTFVVAHTLDPLSQQMELVLGRARLNTGGGPAWHWRQDILGIPPAEGGRRIDGTPQPTGPDTVPDAPVRLRRPVTEERRERANGEQ